MTGLTLRNIMNIAVTGTGTAFPQAGKWVCNEEIHALIFGSLPSTHFWNHRASTQRSPGRAQRR